MPTLLQVRQDGIVWCVLLHLRYIVRSTSDHAEVSRTFPSSYADRLRHTQGVRSDGEEPPDRLLPVFYEFRTGYFRDSCFDPLRIASRYDPPPFRLKRTSEAISNFGSDGIS